VPNIKTAYTQSTFDGERMELKLISMLALIHQQCQGDVRVGDVLILAGTGPRCVLENAEHMLVGGLLDSL
jgi:hypothetical protein